MKAPKQQAITFDEINELIWKHAEARDWHHNPPHTLAISIVLEATELLEHYQWSDKPEGKKEDLAAELADIFIYAIEFAQVNNIDIVEAIRQKLQKSAEKYPAENFKGKSSKASHKAWIDAKLNHRKTGL
ncbi:MAG TPA: MazG-like family protein [Patescibacteria group bacterium]|nr:MazG-like family protein [Patescibacteria group bacterium]